MKKDLQGVFEIFFAAWGRKAWFAPFHPRRAVGWWSGAMGLKVLYIDQLLLVNFAAAAAFLLAAGLLAGGALQRAAAGAGIGLWGGVLPGAAGAGPALAGRPALQGGHRGGVCRPDLRLAGRQGVFAAVRVVFDPHLLLTGAAAALPGGHAANLTAYLDITPGRLLLAVAGVYLGVRALLRFLGKPGQAAVPAQLELLGVRMDVLAFYDSGFTLADPVSGRAVVLVRYDAVRSALPAGCQKSLDGALGRTDALPDPGLGLRYLVCGTIAGRTLLPAVPGAVLTRRAGGRTWREEGLLAAFCTGGAGEGWTLLLGSGLAGRMGL